MKIFLTVGTTKFDQLVKIITTDEILQALNNKGYNALTLQIGKAEIQVDCSPRCGFRQIKSFNFNQSLNEEMMSADLIISHAGAGSCLEALELSKPLIIVANDLLMDNHQLELAQQLYKDGYLYYSNCKGLLELIETMDLQNLKPFSGDKSKSIANKINEIMGFS